VKIDAVLAAPPGQLGAVARMAEAAGFDGGWTIELDHEPFLGALAAALATERLEVGTGIAVGFARNPMILAQAGWDLQTYSGGRFTMGLGSQVKTHIERRYGMPWSAPAARMRDLVLAIRAIWHSWETRGPLDYRGPIYQNTFTSPTFMPDPRDLGDHGTPPIVVAGVGPLMTEVAGEVADGFVVHAFTTQRYLDEVTLPRLRKAREGAGRSMDGFEIAASALVATGETPEQLAASTEAVRSRVGFYASTPAYLSVLETHGWAEAQTQLAGLIRAKDWAGLGAAITDEMLHEFALVGSPAEVADQLVRRYEGRATRVSLAPGRVEDAPLLAAIAAAVPR
jgi:probable F420-dependent oxidoreductase